MSTTPTTSPILSREELLTAARTIAGELRERALETPDGGVTWVGPKGYGTELHPLELRQLGPNLYDGTTGVALFLAALARLDGGGWGETALRAVLPLRRKLRQLASDPERTATLSLRLGGMMGLGSFVYGFLHLGKLLGEPDLVRDAHLVSSLVTPERVRRDHQVRLQTGSAGTLLTLLALHREAPEANAAGRTPLELAVVCGEHLLRERFSWEGYPRAWALSPGKPPLTGFSYGAAGVAYALLRLYEAVPRRDFLDAAREGLDYVRGFYCPERGHWRDMRLELERRYRPRRGLWKDWWASGTLDDLETRDGADEAEVKERFLDRWCHGAAGFVLGRLAALHLDDGPEIREEIAGGLAQARADAFSSEPFADFKADDLCCGYMGRIEMLLTAADRLDDDESRSAAHALMDRVLRRAADRGDFVLSAARGREVFAPTLFQGVSGVGYTLLRLTAPDELPSVLLLE